MNENHERRVGIISIKRKAKGGLEMLVVDASSLDYPRISLHFKQLFGASL